ncbi:MAG TPA: hypothetical protein VFE06_07660, partial [Acidobacteriaceae bacterium]|nr:hypothetical protein [Acidobacteriaceae bacterium]
MRVPLVLAFAGLSASLVFAQQPTPATNPTATGSSVPSVSQAPGAQTPGMPPQQVPAATPG